MYLLIITLHNEEWLDDILSCLIELGIEDAITVDSESMETSLARKAPIFAGLRFELKDKAYSKTILTTTPDKEAGKEIVSFLKEIGIDLEEKGAGRIITLKVESVLGAPQEIEDI
jgi:hypothetical protein